MIDFQKLKVLMKDEQKIEWVKEKELSKATKRTASFSQDGGMGRGFRRGSKTEDGAIILATLDEELENIRAEMKPIREELKKATRKLENPMTRTIINLRYQKGMGPRRIAQEMNYSESRIFAILKKGERQIQSQKQ